MKVAILGAGFMGSAPMRKAFQKVPGVEIAAIYAHSDKRAAPARPGARHHLHRQHRRHSARRVDRRHRQLPPHPGASPVDRGGAGGGQTRPSGKADRPERRRRGRAGGGRRGERPGLHDGARAALLARVSSSFRSAPPMVRSVSSCPDSPIAASRSRPGRSSLPAPISPAARSST